MANANTFRVAFRRTEKTEDAMRMLFGGGNMHRLKLVVFCLVFVANTALPSAGLAANYYYVDPDRGNDANPDGATTAPWRTLAKAKSAVQPGDTVLLRSGNYGTVIFDVSDTSGTSWANKITYAVDPNDPNATPVFSRIDFKETTAKDWYTEISGIAINVPDSGSGVIFRGDVAHVRLLNLTIEGRTEWERWTYPDDSDFGVQFVSGAGSFDDILINGCEVTKFEIGFRLWGNFGPGVIISNNEVHFIAGCGIKISSLPYSDIMTVEGNHIHNQVATGTGADEAHGSGIEIRSSHATIRNNIIHDYGNSCGLRTYGPPADGPYHDLVIENNLIYDVYNYADNAVWLMYSGANVVFRNNTIVGQHIGNTGADWYQRPLRVSSPSGTGGFSLYNNVIVGKVLFLDGAAPDNFVGNIMWSLQDNGVWQSSSPGNIVVNPGDSSQPDYFESSGSFFVGGANFTYALRHELNLTNAFQLAEDSPGIGYADPASATAADILGNPRDGAPDAGCYENVSGPPDSTPPSAPQDLTAQVIGESQMDLSWQQSTDPESGLRYYRIYRNDNPVATPGSTTYSDTGLNAGTEYSYQVSAINWQGLESDKSNIASATTSQDTTAPTILSVGATSETTVTVVFSEALEAASAEDTGNYDITGGISVTSASLAEDLIRVILTTSSHAEGSYTLTVQGVRDVAGNPLVTDSVDYDYASGLVAHWKFDEAGGSTAFDSSGSGHDGTLVNGPTWTTGRLGGALRFDGTNNYIDVGAQDIAAPWTASFWVKREDSLNSNTALLDSANYSLKLEQYPNLNKVGFTAYGVADHAFNYEAPIGSWAHLVFIGTATQVTLYVDGASTETIAASISCPMTQISSASKATKGTIDEVRVYNRALSAAEILTLHDSVSNPGTNNPPVLSGIGDKSVDENSLLGFTISAADPDGDSVTYSAQDLPTGSTLSGQSFSWTPTYDQAGSYDVTFIASDGTDQDSETITVTVGNVNRSPVLAVVGDKSVDENSLLSFSISAADPDGDGVTYSAQNLPTGAALSSQSFTWRPTYDQAGSYNITFVASDGADQDSEIIT
ncbi:MAG: putative Ig domain-containing protein, partial [Planctomycetota bacterium]